MPPKEPSPPKNRRLSSSGRDPRGEEPIIIPAEVFPKASTGTRISTRTASLLKGILLVVILGGMLAGGWVLLKYLGSHPIPVADLPKEKAPSAASSRPEAKKETDPTDQRAQAPSEPEDPAVREKEKQRAEMGMEAYVKAREDLDAMGGAQWGGDEYRQMAKTADEGDAYFLKKEYSSASGRYDQALDMIRRLHAQSGKALDRLMEEGARALDTGDGARAREKFALALKINPAGKGARQGLARAEKVEAVARFMASGKGHEDQGKLAFALADYQEAKKLDPESAQAGQSFERVKERIAGEEFQRLMSSGFEALHREDYQGSRDAFLKARALRPGSREVEDALVQVDQTMRLARIRELQGEALAAEGSEDWERALEAYRGVLEKDPRALFAVEGRERCLRNLRLTKRVAFYLDKPEVLESDQYLEQAEQLLAEAAKGNPGGPRLREHLERLDHLVGIAKTPLPVTLESDNLTEVVVYKVGKLGTFQTKELFLRPGSYTVVGMRTGYKDVRQKVLVKPGQRMQVTVICRERI